MNRKSYEFLKRLHSIGLFYDDGLWWLPIFQWLQIGLGTSMWVLESIVSHRSLFWSLWWHSSIFSKMDSFTNMWVSRSEGQILISALGYFFGSYWYFWFNFWHFFSLALLFSPISRVLASKQQRLPARQHFI